MMIWLDIFWMTTPTILCALFIAFIYCLANMKAFKGSSRDTGWLDYWEAEHRRWERDNQD